MVSQKDERLTVADAKGALLAKAEAASVANYVRANPAEALFTAFAAGLTLGTSGKTMGNFLKAAGMVGDFIGRRR